MACDCCVEEEGVMRITKPDNKRRQGERRCYVADVCCDDHGQFLID